MVGLLDGTELRGSSIGVHKCRLECANVRLDGANIGSDGTDLHQWSCIIGCVELCIFTFSKGRAEPCLSLFVITFYTGNLHITYFKYCVPIYGAFLMHLM